MRGQAWREGAALRSARSAVRSRGTAPGWRAIALRVYTSLLGGVALGLPFAWGLVGLFAPWAAVPALAVEAERLAAFGWVAVWALFMSLGASFGPLSMRPFLAFALVSSPLGRGRVLVRPWLLALAVWTALGGAAGAAVAPPVSCGAVPGACEAQWTALPTVLTFALAGAIAASAWAAGQLLPARARRLTVLALFSIAALLALLPVPLSVLPVLAVLCWLLAAALIAALSCALRRALHPHRNVCAPASRSWAPPLR